MAGVLGPMMGDGGGGIARFQEPEFRLLETDKKNGLI